MVLGKLCRTFYHIISIHWVIRNVTLLLQFTKYNKSRVFSILRKKKLIKENVNEVTKKFSVFQEGVRAYASED